MESILKSIEKIKTQTKNNVEEDKKEDEPKKEEELG